MDKKDMDDKKKELIRKKLDEVVMRDVGYKMDHIPMVEEKDKKTYPHLSLKLSGVPFLEKHDVGETVRLVVEATIVAQSAYEMRGKKDKRFELKIKKVGELE